MNLLFDLGGVIVDIRRQRCVDAFKALGFADIDHYLGDYGQKGAFLALEDGSMTPAQFRDAIRRHIPHAVTDEEIDRAFTDFIIGIPRHRLRALRRLRAEGHRLYVVSTISRPLAPDTVASQHAAVLYVHGYTDYFIQAEQGDRCTAQGYDLYEEGGDITTYFDGVVTSFEAGACKPDERIFRLCCERFGIKPEETVFFDDSADNCTKGAALGFRAVHVPPGTEFETLIPKE